MTTQVTLRPLSDDDWPQLNRFSLPDDQAGFSAAPATTMQGGAARDGHVICDQGKPAGFFAIDRDYAEAHDFAGGGTIGLRMFLVDHGSQGRGLASAACRAMRAYLSAQYPDRSACYLTVNCRNPAAKRVYEKGGFEDTGALYLEGGFGPQHILSLALCRR